MTRQELEAAAQSNPFEAFSVTLSTGQQLEVPRPDLIMVGKHSACVGVITDPTSPEYDVVRYVDRKHILSIDRNSHRIPAPVGGTSE